MKKIIWGIAAVFCVQVGFQLAMTAERSNDDYARLSTPLQNSIADVKRPPIDPELLQTNIYTADEASFARAGRSGRTVPTAQHAYARVERVPRRDTPHSATSAFKPVVITYDRRGALTRAAPIARKQDQTPKTQSTSDDKRSLIAKIVTKPYDWLKVVGSKLR